MLHKISFENFQSFREKTEIDFTINEKVPPNDWMTTCETGTRVSKIMAIIGPNGSGKTALLKPLAFLDWFISDSFSSDPDDEIQFLQHFAAQGEPSKFSIEVAFDQSLWRYELECTPRKVLHEALYKKYDRFRYVFIRDWDETTESYQVKQNDFGLLPKEARKVRPNASLISTAAQYDVPLAKKLLNSQVYSNVNFIGRMSTGQSPLLRAAQHYFSNADHFEKMKTLLTSWDLGLSDIDVKEIENTDDEGKVSKFYMPIGMHHTKNVRADLPFVFESTGTQSAFVLLTYLLKALDTGGIAVIDEFESDLHPHMLEPIINLFSHPRYNPHNAQLLFSCHAMEVLNILHKSQVMLVEKDDECQSSSCRLDKIEKHVRSTENYYAKYMAGAYGAIPHF